MNKYKNTKLLGAAVFGLIAIASKDEDTQIACGLTAGALLLSATDGGNKLLAEVAKELTSRNRAGRKSKGPGQIIDITPKD